MRGAPDTASPAVGAPRPRLGASVSVVAIIPARLASTRLPGKALADIGGVPMVVRVARRVRQSQVDGVFIASGDGPILDAARAHGIAAIETARDLPSGTHRVAAAAGTLDAQVVVNVQGDEPFIDPSHVDAVAGAIGPATVATLAAPLGGDPHDPSTVKARFDVHGYATAFSRSAGSPPWWHHVGLYAFDAAALPGLVALPETPAERRERLEQLRWLDHGVRIRIVRVRRAALSVDTPDDLERARRALA